ncbi:HD-GYP domain-containing protein [Bacillus solimangrovi]|uniref:Histidine kinase n=1 Tax=Bacillus solimangrovi TaxID=1305675 RepID=A0A1E5LIP8_9BACI|nr:HD-GYP domain-containing protein [Bacillus solimangrovi]OEH93962.1 histidine kinase [Bacillus solimangrovi]
MRLVSIDSLRENVVLEKPIFNDKGQVLLGEGVVLTNKLINRLKEHGVDHVCIVDQLSEGIKLTEPISIETRMQAMSTIKETLESVHKNHDLSKAFVQGGLDKQFNEVIRNILRDISRIPEAISLMSDVYSYDNYIFSHSLNVTIYSLALAYQLKLSPRELEEIGIGAMLHDVGKMMVPIEILTKPGRLTDEEFVEMKNHAEYGFNILRKVPTLSLVTAHCAYQHHERIDGSGYPRGLKGRDIHYYSRIIAVADVYDAVTSNRVYRRAMLPHEGLEILYAGSGTQFDKELIDAFRKAIIIYPPGLKVELSDQRKGIVIRSNPGLSERPIIRIIEEAGRQCGKPYELDLSKDLNTVITGADLTL